MRTSPALTKRRLTGSLSPSRKTTPDPNNHQTGVPDGTPVFENSKNYISGAIVTKGQINTAAF